MRRLLIPVVMLILAGTACGSERSADLALEATSPKASQSNVTTTSPAQGSSEFSDLAVFLAAVDMVLVDTSYSGSALTDAELFIATGQLFCERLESGASQDEVLDAHLDAMTDARGGAIRDDDVLAAGAVMGASIEVICPEFAP